MSAVNLRTYREDENTSYEGEGLKINNSRIIAHYSTLGFKVFDFSTDWQSIPLRIYLVGTGKYIVEQIPLRIAHIWQCSSFKKFFLNYFKVDDFGNRDVKDCATFVLLKPEKNSNKGNIKDILLGMNAIPTREIPKYSQGTKVTVKKRNVKSNLSKRQRFEENSVISYTFGGDHVFTIDTDVNPGSIVYRCGKNKEEEPIGIAIYTDIFPLPFQVFPLCISLTHLLSELYSCSNYSCIPSLTSFTPNDSIISGLYLVQCGSRIGTGCLIEKGIILTCCHILTEHKESDITVCSNNVSSKANVIYMNEHKGWPDIALLETSSSDCESASPLTIASRPIALGERVLVAGIPYVKGWYKADPWISCGRVVYKTVGGIIASCSVHEGFSGGCLLDQQGQVLGVICGKAFPGNEMCTPPRLAQVFPITGLKYQILRFVFTTPRTQTDVESLTKSFLSSRELNPSKL